MPGSRIERINEEVQREVSALIRRLKDPRVNAVGMISVTRAEVTRDLRYCKVYISVMDSMREQETLRGLKSAAGYMRRELGRKLGLRYTPQLEFEIDHSIARGAHVLKILRNVKYAEDSEKNPAKEREPVWRFPDEEDRKKWKVSDSVIEEFLSKQRAEADNNNNNNNNTADATGLEGNHADGTGNGGVIEE